MNTILIEGFKLEIPTSKVSTHLRIRDKMVVSLDENWLPRCLVTRNLEIRRKYVAFAWMMTSGVWCFQLSEEHKTGTFLWKAPEVVDRNHPDLRGIDLTLHFHGSAYVQFKYNEK